MAMALNERQAHDAKWREINEYLKSRNTGLLVNWMFDYVTEGARYRMVRIRPKHEVLMDTHDETAVLNMLSLLVSQMEVERDVHQG